VAALMIGVDLVTERNRNVYVLFAIRPIRRDAIVWAKFFAVFACVTVACIVSLVLGVLVDLARGVAMANDGWYELGKSLLSMIAAIGLATAGGALFGVVFRSVLLVVILGFYVCQNITLVPMLPVYFHVLPNLFWLDMGISYGLLAVLLLKGLPPLVLILLTTAVLPGCVALAAHGGQLEGGKLLFAYLLGFVATLAADLLLANLLSMRGLKKMEKSLRQKFLSEGASNADSSGLFVGLAPDSSPRVYEGNWAWDFGFLTLMPELLSYQGEEVRFSLARGEISSINLGPGPIGWFKVPSVYLTWRDSAGRETVFNLRPLRAGSMIEMAARTRQMADDLDRRTVDRRQCLAQLDKRLVFDPLDQMHQDIVEHSNLLLAELGNETLSQVCGTHDSYSKGTHQFYRTRIDSRDIRNGIHG